MMRLMLLTLTLLLCSSAIQPTVVRSAAGENAPLQLLRESSVIGNKIEGNERIFYLYELTRVAVRIPSVDTKTAAAICEDLFVRAFKMPDGWDRVAAEKNALVSLSARDPQRAMILFLQVEDPRPQSSAAGLIFPEDVRADAAIDIFPNYWQSAGRDGLPQIMKVAEHIGDTGEYPYSAMGLIIKELGKIQDDEGRAEANGILSEAMGYYQRGSALKFRNRRDEFLELLQNAKSTVSNAQFASAVELFVDRLLNDPAPAERYLGEIGTSRGTLRFTDSNRAFLFRVFHFLSEVNPRRAARLSQLYPDLTQADGNILYAAYTVGRGTLPESQTTLNENLQRSVRYHLESLQQTNPQAALQVAETQPTPGLRLAGLSVLLNTDGEPDALTKSIYQEAMQQVGRMPEGIAKLSDMSQLAKTAYAVKDFSNFYALSATVFEKGTKAFHDDSLARRQRPTDARPGYPELSEIVRFAASNREDWLVERVREMPDGILKAHLLIHAAKGAAEAEQKPSADGPAQVAGIK
jgi:hypothetical protein